MTKTSPDFATEFLEQHTSKVAEEPCVQAAQKDSEARRAFIEILAIKRDREIWTSTTTNHEHEPQASTASLYDVLQLRHDLGIGLEQIPDILLDLFARSGGDLEISFRCIL